MGTDLAEYLFDFNLRTIWVIRTLERRLEKETRISKKITRLVRLDQLTKDAAETKKNDFKITSDFAELSNAEIIIECISENLESKRELFLSIRQFVNEKTVILSNTSSLPLCDIFEPLGIMQRCAGLHFFYPIQLKNIVEINLCPQNDNFSIEKINQFLELIERKSITLELPHHFVLNRIFFLYLAQAFRIYEAGELSIDEIDALVEKELFPIGPFKFIDNVGLDILLQSIKQYISQPHEQAFCDSWLEAMDCLVKNGCLGVKSGRGFYKSSISFRKDFVSKKADVSLKTDMEERVATKLFSVFVNSLFSELNKGYTTLECLCEVIQEYLGLENNLKKSIIDFGVPLIVSTLENLHVVTKDDIYKPLPLLEIFADQFDPVGL